MLSATGKVNEPEAKLVPSLASVAVTVKVVVVAVEGGIPPSTPAVVMLSQTGCPLTDQV
jgi:hypothetical protein